MEVRSPPKGTQLTPSQAPAAELRPHYLFAALTEAQWAAILPHVHLHGFDAKQRLFSQGDRGVAFFLLRRGVVKLFRVSAEGQEKIMRLIHPQMSFAESVMFMDEPRYPVHAEGVEPGEVIAIDAAAYLELLEDSFATCRTVMAQMTQRIQAHWDEIEALTLQNSRYRIVNYLLGLVPEGAGGEVRVRLPSRKSLIATQHAVTPETLSRVLHGLGEEGLIEVRDYDVRIPDVAALRRHLS